MGAGMIPSQEEVGTFYRFTTGGNNSVYEGEAMTRIPKNSSLYKVYPVFTHQKNGSHLAVDKCTREDRIVFRLMEGRLLAVMVSRIYEKIKRPDWAQ